MKKLLAALIAGLFSVATVAPVVAAEKAKDDKAKKDEKAKDDKAKK